MPAESVEVGGVLHISAHGVEFIFGIDAAKRIRIDVVEFGVGVLNLRTREKYHYSFELNSFLCLHRIFLSSRAQ